MIIKVQVRNMDEVEVAELASRRGHAMREKHTAARMLKAAQANGHSTAGEYVAASMLQAAQANGHSTVGGSGFQRRHTVECSDFVELGAFELI